MSLSKELTERINYLLDLAEKVIATKKTTGKYNVAYVEPEMFKEFQMSSLSFIINLYRANHPYYISFNHSVDRNTLHVVETARGILKSIKTEIERGWLLKIKTLVSAEIFSDFLDMAKYLLDEGYKDSAAVMIGSVLEENLRQIAEKNSIDLIFTNGTGEIKPKKADTLNADIVKSGHYTKLDQKQVTAWLDLRNKAAHGLYNEYTHDQVNIMYQGVLDFITRNNL